MNKKTLILIPGLSSPFGEERYQLARRLLFDEAPKHGYSEVLLVTLPGQRQDDGTVSGQLSLPNAVDVVVESLRVQEARGTPYRLLGLSFGGIVCLAAASRLELRHCQDVVIWGPAPYWLVWQVFVRGIYRDRLAKDTFLIPDAEFFQTFVPFEHLLQLERSGQRQSIRIASGGNDIFCPPFYLRYLEELCINCRLSNIRFVLVPDCPHNVTKTDSSWPDYVNAILS